MRDCVPFGSRGKHFSIRCFCGVSWVVRVACGGVWVPGAGVVVSMPWAASSRVAVRAGYVDWSGRVRFRPRRLWGMRSGNVGFKGIFFRHARARVIREAFMTKDLNRIGAQILRDHGKPCEHGWIIPLGGIVRRRRRGAAGPAASGGPTARLIAARADPRQPAEALSRVADCTGRPDRPPGIGATFSNDGPGCPRNPTSTPVPESRHATGRQLTLLRSVSGEPPTAHNNGHVRMPGAEAEAGC
jgi:hypothetical protein